MNGYSYTDYVSPPLSGYLNYVTEHDEDLLHFLILSVGHRKELLVIYLCVCLLFVCMCVFVYCLYGRVCLCIICVCDSMHVCGL